MAIQHARTRGVNVPTRIFYAFHVRAHRVPSPLEINNFSWEDRWPGPIIVIEFMADSRRPDSGRYVSPVTKRNRVWFRCPASRGLCRQRSINPGTQHLDNARIHWHALSDRLQGLFIEMIKIIRRINWEINNFVEALRGDDRDRGKSGAWRFLHKGLCAVVLLSAVFARDFRICNLIDRHSVVDFDQLLIFFCRSW